MKTKAKVVRITVEIGIVIIICIILFIVNEQINDNRNNSFLPVEDSNAYVYQVEKVYENEDDYVIQGWFIELKKVKNKERDVTSDKNLAVILYDIEAERPKDLDGNLKPAEGINLRVEHTVRNDVNEYFKCEYDYSNCGFLARIKKSDICLENRCYRVVFKLRGEDDKGILSSFYLANGQIRHVNPNDYMIPDVMGTDLENIAKEGICVAGCPEYHICVYQYGKKLYWIAEKGFLFEDDGSTYIQYSMDTTQFDKLPEKMKSNGWYWSNLGGNFEDYEITDTINCGKYRVCVRSIPSEYSVTWIDTGYYKEKDLVWMRVIRPDYAFCKE